MVGLRCKLFCYTMEYLRKLKVRLVRGEYKNPLKGQIRNSKEVYRIFKDIKNNASETCIAIYLDNDLRPLAYNVISTGTLSCTIVEPRDVYGYGFVLLAKYFILIHNHPHSGIAKPSQEDHEMMQLFIDSAHYMQMRFLDFIIVGDRNYWSLYKEHEHGEDRYETGAIF